MFKKSILISLLMAATLVLLVACSTNNIQPTATVDIEATVNAIVQENMDAQANTQATIEAAVQATQTAIAAQVTPVVADENYYSLSEEQLAAMIDEAVAAALEASEEVSSSTSTATYDNTVSEEEVVYVTYAVAYADEAVAYAEELLSIYNDVYGEFADEAITAVYEIESELESISNSLDAMEELLYQGADAVNVALNELNAAAQQMEDKLISVQEQTQNWKNDFESAGQNRTEEMLNMLPNMEAADRSQMIDMINGFAEDIRTGLGDGALNREEIQRISQSGANAQAAIDKFGGPQMQGWSDSITNLTRVSAQGNPVELQSMLKNFSVGLPELNNRR